jgi:hypothetical protein
MRAQKYYFENIPNVLKIYFPELLNTDEKDDLMTMEMQRINGPPLSYCYVNGKYENLINADSSRKSNQCAFFK